MRTRKQTAGFTLVELLVVISIITMLAGMLLPAIQRARAAARLADCIDHQRNIGFAMLHYEGTEQRLPGWRNYQTPGGRTISWVFALLPYLDRNDLYNAYGANGSRANGLPSEHLKILVCPDDADSINSGANMSYVVNTGRLDPAPGGGNPNPADGVFLDGARNQRMSLGGIADGAATTLMLSENIDATLWTADSEECVGFNWSVATAINRQTGVSDCTARPSSYHGGVVVVTFCDGHTRSLSENIAVDVYQLLMTSRGDSVNPPQTRLLTEEF